MEYVFVGAFGKASKGRAGGQLTACQTLVGSPISKYVKWSKLDSTMRSIPPPPLATRALHAARRTFSFARMVRPASVTGALIFTSAGASFIEKGLMVLIARAFGKRVVLSPRSGLIPDDLERSPLIRRFARLVLRRCDVVICQSRSWRDFYQSLSGLPSSHFAVIPNWLDATPYLELPGPMAKASKQVHIIYVGWIETYKGVYDLVEAVSLFREPLKNCRIHVCGEGNESQGLRQRVADAGLSHLFEFHGWLNFPEKLEQLGKADVFVLPSHREGLPNALLEAMAAGLPVIATRVGGVPEVLDEDGVGILLEPHDSTALGEALAELVGKAELRVSLGKRAREHVLAQYDVSLLWQSVLDSLSLPVGS